MIVMRPCSESAEAEGRRFSIVGAVAEVRETFPHTVTLTFERYFAQEIAIERWLAENLGSNGLVHDPSSEVGASGLPKLGATFFRIPPDARYASMGKGSYFFKDGAWACAFKLFFG
jgi:hypothetical protein